MPSQMLLKLLVEKHERAADQGAIGICKTLLEQLTRFKAVCLGEERDCA